MFTAEVDPDRVAAYIRWSTDEQGHGTTLAVQRERVGLFIRSQGWRFREELLFVDEGFSGATLDRPALTELREAVRSGMVRCVVVYRLDRLSRSLLDTVNLVRQEWEGRAVLCSATENFDTHSPVGQMVFNILASFAEFERNLIRDRTASGKRKRAEQGRNAGQRYPMGYRKGAGGGWALDGRDPASGALTGPAALVRRIFEAFLAGAGTGAIARSLNAEGVATPQGRSWRFHYVARLLRNPIYAGRYRYGRGARATQVAGAAPPIVSEEEFERVQRLLQDRSCARSAPAAYLLSGLVRCGRCSSPVAGSKGRERRYYVCTGRRLLQRCDCGYIDAELVESAVLTRVRQWMPGPPADRERLERWRLDLAGEQRSLVRQLESERAALERQRRRLEDRFLAEQLAPGEYSRLVERLDTALAELAVRHGEALCLLRAMGEAVPEPDRLDAWAALTPEEVREVVRLLTAEVTIYRPMGTGGRRLPVRVSFRRRQKTRPHNRLADGWGGFTSYSCRPR
ncbi:MAG: recombinase family protein [Bacillota bacterium]